MTNLKDLIVSTLHSSFDDHPWVEFNKGQEIKVVHVRPSENLIAMQLRAQPFVIGTPHKHVGFTFGFTTRGAWSHNPKTFPYKPNSYVCEPINELHRYCNGPEISETYFINIGEQQYYDDEGREVIRRSTPETLLAKYFQKCEEAGLPRPNVLA